MARVKGKGDMTGRRGNGGSKKSKEAVRGGGTQSRELMLQVEGECHGLIAYFNF